MSILHGRKLIGYYNVLQVSRSFFLIVQNLPHGPFPLSQLPSFAARSTQQQKGLTHDLQNEDPNSWKMRAKQKWIEILFQVNQIQIEHFCTSTCVSNTCWKTLSNKICFQDFLTPQTAVMRDEHEVTTLPHWSPLSVTQYCIWLVVEPAHLFQIVKLDHFPRG